MTTLPEFLLPKQGLSNLHYVFRFYDDSGNVMLETRSSNTQDVLATLGSLEFSTTVDLASSIGQMTFTIKPVNVVNQLTYSRCTLTIEKQDLGGITHGFDYENEFSYVGVFPFDFQYWQFSAKYNCILGWRADVNTYPNIGIV